MLTLNIITAIISTNIIAIIAIFIIINAMYSVIAPTVLLQYLTSAACGAARWRWGNRRRKSSRTRRNFSMSSYTDTTNGFDQDSAVSVITVRMIRILLIIIYPIICLKSVDVRRQQVVILALSPREMSQTDRILPRYILSRVRVSVRPRFFLYAKKPQATVARILRSALRR